MSLEDSWRDVKAAASSATPKRKGTSAGGKSVTPRDFSNVGLSGTVGVIITWLVHDVAGLPVSPEVSIAFGTLGGYVVGRLLMY